LNSILFSDDVNHAWNIFKDTFLAALDVFAPVKRVRATH
jgi:hypothetical protein